MGLRISQMQDANALSGNELVEVTQLSSTVVIAAATISAQASDNSYNDSANGFVSAGFAIGDSVNIAGFTGNAANNIFSAKVTALTAGKMTIGGTDGDVIVDDAAGETVTITKWNTRKTTAADLAGAGTPASSPYVASGFYPGVPAASVILAYIPFALSVDFAVNLSGSVGKAKVAATAQTDFDVKKNGSSVGTMRFAAAATTASFIAASPVSFVAGDTVEITAPGTPDATLANIGWVLKGTRV